MNYYIVGAAVVVIALLAWHRKITTKSAGDRYVEEFKSRVRRNNLRRNNK